VVSQLEERTKAPAMRDNCLIKGPTMFQVATEIGRLLRTTIEDVQRANGDTGKGRFTATMILAGQIAGMQPRLFMIYPEGNFIEASWDTPFFQIGETKYGRPILIRGYDRQMSFEEAVKLLMVSFDSTLKANLSVGLPLDLLVIAKDAFAASHEHRVTAEDPYFDTISSGWGNALKAAFQSLPSYRFSDDA
jgi:putative proteasome-type protease